MCVEWIKCHSASYSIWNSSYLIEYCGATHSLICNELVQSIEKRINVTRAKSSVRSRRAYGQPKTALDTFDCNVKFNKSSSYAQTFLIIEDNTNLNYPVLLGMDFLKSNKAKINIERWKLTLAGRELPSTKKRTEESEKLNAPEQKSGEISFKKSKMLHG